MVDKSRKSRGHHRRCQECERQRAVFSGSFSQPSHHAGRLQLEPRAGRRGFDAAAGENFGKLAYFHVRRKRALAQACAARRVLVIAVELTKSRGKIGKARGVCSVDGETVSEAEVTFMLFDRQ